MKKIAIAATLLAGVAFAADTMTATVFQSGNGSNCMTASAPSLATDGVAAQSSAPSISPRQFASSAVVAIRALSTHTFNACPVQSYMRGWCYQLDPAGSGSQVWGLFPALDITVDAGVANNLISYQLALPAQGTCTRFAWTAENVSQTSVQDGGVNVLEEAFAPDPLVTHP